MKNVVTFGEILLRLTPPGYEKFVQTERLCASFGGSETNVAVSLAQLGLKSEFVTRLPENPIAEMAINSIARYGVGTSKIVRGGDRVGLYYYENTPSMRESKVVYDRAESSFATSGAGDYDWEKIFRRTDDPSKTVDWFHWSGIGPSLSQEAADATLAAVRTARRMGITVSSDLNYRKNLWRYGKTSYEIMPDIAKECDVLFGTEGEYEKTFGIKPLTDFTMKSDKEELDIEPHREFCEKVMKVAEKCKLMFVALRNVVDASHHVFIGLLMTREGEMLQSKTYMIDPVVDCVGCGDAFAAGMIYGINKYPNDNRQALEAATAAAVLKNTMRGDFNLSTAEEVENLKGGDTSGRISR
ncbi:MAG: sugar kinase [Bacteroidales bacterium]|jgi:2-dehydro-3-deoxygluconokinase|nr:sugar kinase [Bacteroidales bacterium]